jgi:hypothetical protein
MINDGRNIPKSTHKVLNVTNDLFPWTFPGQQQEKEENKWVKTTVEPVGCGKATDFELESEDRGHSKGRVVPSYSGSGWNVQGWGHLGYMSNDGQPVPTQRLGRDAWHGTDM